MLKKDDELFVRSQYHSFASPAFESLIREHKNNYVFIFLVLYFPFSCLAIQDA